MFEGVCGTANKAGGPRSGSSFDLFLLDFLLVASTHGAARVAT
jgi:hypothetical protein